jgi:hypothetical protein
MPGTDRGNPTALVLEQLFAQDYWHIIALGKMCDISFIDETTEFAKCAIEKPFAMDIIIMSCWHIRMSKNNLNLKKFMPSIQRWKQNAKDLNMIIHRAKKKRSQAFKDWIQHHL